MESVTPNGNLEESFLSVVYSSFTNLGNSRSISTPFRNVCTNMGWSLWRKAVFAQTGQNQSPPPGGGWPRRGRERNAGGNLKVCMIKQASTGIARRRTPVEVLTYTKQKHSRPHSSSVRKTVLWDRFSDSWELWCDCPRQS